MYYLCSDNAKFINHSDIPNCISDGRTDFTLKDISKDEELLYNYWEFHKGNKL